MNVDIDSFKKMLMHGIGHGRKNPAAVVLGMALGVLISGFAQITPGWGIVCGVLLFVGGSYLAIAADMKEPTTEENTEEK